VDVHVDVKIPGGVNAYAIDLRGERCPATADIWQETYLSAILRAILYSDDPTFSLEAYWRLEPISMPDAELFFFQVGFPSRRTQVPAPASLLDVLEFCGDLERVEHALAWQIVWFDMRTICREEGALYGQPFMMLGNTLVLQLRRN